MSDVLPGLRPARAEPPAKRGPGLGGWLLAMIFALPVLGGLAVRMFVGGRWLRDLDAVTCAAWRTGHHISPYAHGLACPIGQPTDYMYLPQLARLLAPLAHGGAAVALRSGLALLVLAAAGFLLWALVLRPMSGAPRLLRGAIAALTTGGALAVGNLALVCHALVLGVGLIRRRGPWALIATIVIVSILKPVYLTYLLIFAYEPEPFTVRARRIGGGLALAGLAALLVLTTGGGQLGAWKTALAEIALRAQPGYGFLSWTDRLGLSAAEPAVLVAFVVFAGLVCLSGLAVAEVRGLDRQGRLLLALAVAQIVNPRPMAYDLIMLAPLAVAFAGGSATSRRMFRWGLYGLGVMATALLLAGTDLAQRLGPAALTLALFVAGGLAIRDGFGARKAGRAPSG
jgi:hypothetical protein